jgi:hypothetical protein
MKPNVLNLFLAAVPVLSAVLLEAVFEKPLWHRLIPGMRGRLPRKQEASVPPQAVPPMFLLTPRPGAWRRGLIPSGICSNTKTGELTMTTPTETTKEKQIPAFYIFDTVESDGKKDSKRVGAAFAHKKGTGYSFLINGKRYAAFPPKVKTAAEAVQPEATGEKGA